RPPGPRDRTGQSRQGKFHAKHLHYAAFACDSGAGQHQLPDPEQGAGRSAGEMILRRTILILRLVLGAIFLYAAWTKLRQSYLIFAMSIDAYQLLPSWAVLLIARTLPWFELAVGVLLLIGYKLRWVSVAA